MRSLLPQVALVGTLLSFSSGAFAQDGDPNCPPGSWFCEGNGAGTAEPPPELPPPKPAAPPPKAEAPKGGTTVVVPGAQPGPPPVVVYQQAPPPPPPVVVVRHPPRYVPPPPPPPKKKSRQRRWAFNLHLLGVMMDDEEDQNAGMGGLGFAFRARPARHFALDFGLDLVGGRDYHGNRRSEVPFSINALVYANPRSKVQFYMLGGIGWSHARVELEEDPDAVVNYNYFGGQMGAGLEIRLSQPVSLNLDILGFIRGRTDRDARDNPEFVDPVSGRTTNTSGGGLLRGGISFYW